MTENWTAPSLLETTGSYWQGCTIMAAVELDLFNLLNRETDTPAGLAARIGGVLCVALALVLAGYAWRAPTRPYKRTELWLILAKDKRPPAAYAQRVIGAVLRDTYIWFSRQSAVIAIVLLAVSGLLQVLGVTELWDEPSRLAAVTADPLPGAKGPPHIPAR